VNGLLTDGILAAQMGTEVVQGTMTIPDYYDLMVTANGTTATTEFTPVGTAGAEIGYIYKRNDDGSIGQKYAQAAEASATEFALDGKEITLPTGAFGANESVVALYSYSNPGSKRITNDVDNMAITARIVLDLLVESLCDGKTYPAKFVFYRAHFNANFDLAFGEDYNTLPLCA
jgi:hypothetical protein